VIPPDLPFPSEFGRIYLIQTVPLLLPYVDSINNSVVQRT
jgi:hypothetical protein